MKKILITGGTGFIGINLVKYILKNRNNIKIYILSRKSQLVLEEKEYKLFKNINFIKGDISTFKTNIKFDEIYHLAYDTNIKNDYLKYTSRTIIEGAINICNVCMKSKAKRMVFLSSGAIYENLKKIKYKPNEQLKFNLFDYKQHYGIAKASSEQYLWSMLSETSTQLSIYRVFTVIGPYMRLDGNFILGNVIRNILKNKKNIFKTDCKVFRNIIFIDDLIKQILDFNKKDKFIVKNIVGKTVFLKDFLISLSKIYKLDLKFGIKKNIYRINYSPEDKGYRFHKNYLFDNFDKTLIWFRSRKNKKIRIS